MLEIVSPNRINDSPYRRRLAEAGIKGGWNYALDHAWLFEKIDQYLKSSAIKFPVIVDVGCGNSMFHPFLEKELSLGIIGIDRINGLCPHPQRTNLMDYCVDFRTYTGFPENSADIIFWLSSIEHNSLEGQRECLRASLRVLKPGGLFLATFGFAPETLYYEPSQQTNLSAVDAARVFGVEWKDTPDFYRTVEEFRLDLMEWDTRHTKRYQTHDYAFVVAGAEIIKTG